MADFNQYSDNYSEHIDKSIGFAGQDHDFYLHKKSDFLIKTAQRRLGDTGKLSLLDIGCGIGLMERFLCPAFAHVEGVDIAESEIDVAKKTAPSAMFQAYDGNVLPFNDAQFDVVFACCVLHHVPPACWESFCREAARVTRPGGLFFVFEHNPLNPLTRLAVSKNEFDKDASLLGRGTSTRLLTGAGLRITERPYIIFFPWASRVLSAVELGLTWFPMGAQYAVVGEKAVT